MLLLIRFPRQEYWSWLPFPSPGDLPDPGIKLKSPALAGGFFTTEQVGKLRSFNGLQKGISSSEALQVKMIRSFQSKTPELLSSQMAPETEN